jgi:hypothetical protein
MVRRLCPYIRPIPRTPVTCECRVFNSANWHVCCAVQVCAGGAWQCGYPLSWLTRFQDGNRFPAQLELIVREVRYANRLQAIVFRLPRACRGNRGTVDLVGCDRHAGLPRDHDDSGRLKIGGASLGDDSAALSGAMDFEASRGHPGRLRNAQAMQTRPGT